MSGPDHRPKPDHRPAPGHGGRRNGLLLAGAGALVGAGSAVLGRAVWRRRRQSEDDSAFGVESGRGMPEAPPSPWAVAKGFETEDMSAALMGGLTIGLGVAIAVAISLMLAMSHAFQASRDAAPGFTAQQRQPIVPPAPHLQAAPWTDLAALRDSETDRLRHYGWITPDHSSARIPIDVAIGRTVGRSLDGAP